MTTIYSSRSELEKHLNRICRNNLRKGNVKACSECLFTDYMLGIMKHNGWKINDKYLHRVNKEPERNDYIIKVSDDEFASFVKSICKRNLNRSDVRVCSETCLCIDEVLKVMDKNQWPYREEFKKA